MTTTIQSIIVETLLEYTEVEYQGKTMKVGKTYDEVLESVKAKVKQHPMLGECETSKNCVTWYASKMRNKDTKFFNQLMLEIERPRLSTKAPKATTAVQVKEEAPAVPKAAPKKQITAKA